MKLHLMINLMLTLVAGHELMVEMTAEIEVMGAVEIEVMVAVESEVMVTKEIELIVAVHVGINCLEEPVPCKILSDTSIKIILRIKYNFKFSVSIYS